MLLKRKISGIAFVTLTVAPYLLFLLLQLNQQFVKWEKRKELDHQPLQTVVIPVSSVVWLEQGKELIIDNKLFDLKTFTIADGKLTATGIFDGDETHLLNKLHSLSAKHKKGALQSQAFMALLLSSYHQCSENFVFSVAPDKLIHAEKPSLPLLTNYIPVFSPPPRRLFIA